MTNLAYWIWFSSLRGLTFRTRRALLARFADAKGIYFAEREELRRIEGIGDAELEAVLTRDLAAAVATVDRCGELDISILTIQDAAYPERLRNIPDPPCVLYVKGRLPAVDAEPVIGFVGTRRSTPYGDKMARNIAYSIASKGGVIATGLAGGIDSRAAEGALMAGGRVLGVLGVAINDVYPKWNAKLYADVQASGALISEYPPDAQGSSAWFPARNRIIAGLSVGVVIGEAPVRSGALITAHRALDYGRDVFVIPGNADAPASRGSNNLLREGAFLAENGWDVLKEYAAQFPDRIDAQGRNEIPAEQAIPEATRAAEAAQAEDAPGLHFLKLQVPVRKKPPEPIKLSDQLRALTPQQLAIVGVMEKPNMHVDDIIDLSRLPASAVLSELTLLQIKGFVTQSAGKRFTLNIKK
jgi:DNA processing protein